MTCYFQHEKSRKVHNEVSEKRKVFRKSYDTTGPNDERYYVSASSGIGKNINILLGLFYGHKYDPFYFQGQMEAKLKLTHQGRRRKEIFLLNFCRTKFLTTTTTKYHGSCNNHQRKTLDHLRLRLRLLTTELAADWPGDTCPDQ